MEEFIEGITKFCVHPQSALKTKTIVGGTKNLNLDRIVALNPDFILANKEENDKASIEFLSERFPTYVSEVRTLEQAITMIKDVGAICGKENQANGLISNIKSRFSTIENHDKTFTAAYLIWQNPWMTVSEDTFIHDMLSRCGFENVFGCRSDSRYPIVTDEQIRQANPEIIFLSSEPYPFKTTHITTLKRQFPNSHLAIVDGEMFSWYGSRLQHFNTRIKTDVMSSTNHP